MLPCKRYLNWFDISLRAPRLSPCRQFLPFGLNSGEFGPIVAYIRTVRIGIPKRLLRSVLPAIQCGKHRIRRIARVIDECPKAITARQQFVIGRE